MLSFIGAHYVYLAAGAAIIFMATLAFASLTDRDPSPRP